MEFWEILLTIAGISALFGILISVSSRRIALRRDRVVEAKFRELLPGVEITRESGSVLRFRAETPETLFLVKVVPLSSQTELIVTNPDFWCLNSNPAGWNRSSSPVLVPGVREFRRLSPETSKRIVKIGLIYPDAFSISRYLNESEVEIVRWSTDVDGMRLVRFPELDLFFAKLEKK